MLYDFLASFLWWLTEVLKLIISNKHVLHIVKILVQRFNKNVWGGGGGHPQILLYFILYFFKIRNVKIKIILRIYFFSKILILDIMCILQSEKFIFSDLKDKLYKNVSIHSNQNFVKIQGSAAVRKPLLSLKFKPFWIL